MSYHTTATGGHFTRRVEEKEELQKISERFAAYIARVQKLRDDKNASVDPAGFIRAAKILEDEIRALKSMYEHELDKLRNQGDQYKRENNNLQMQNEKSYQLCKDLQARLDSQNAKNDALADEIKRLRSQVNQMEMKYKEAQENAAKPNAECERLRSDLKRALRDLEEANARYEQETGARQDCDSKAKSALEKLRLAEQVHAKEMANLKDRLDAANATILEMERKMKSNKSSMNVEAMIKQVRDAADAELNKFKEDCKAQYAKNVAVLKEQLDDAARTIEKLTRENQQLRSQVEDLRLKNSQQDGQIAALQNEIRALEAQLAQERQQSAANLQAMNNKMKEFQDQMYSKLHQSGGISDDSVMLKAEISALKAMLEEEENRLQSRNRSRPPSSLPDISRFNQGGNTSRINANAYGHSYERSGKYTPRGYVETSYVRSNKQGNVNSNNRAVANNANPGLARSDTELLFGMGSARLGSSRGSSKLGKSYPMGFGLSHARTEYRDKYTTPGKGRRF